MARSPARSIDSWPKGQELLCCLLLSCLLEFKNVVAPKCGERSRCVPDNRVERTQYTAKEATSVLDNNYSV